MTTKFKIFNVLSTDEYIIYYPDTSLENFKEAFAYVFNSWMGTANTRNSKIEAAKRKTEKLVINEFEITEIIDD